MNCKKAEIPAFNWLFAIIIGVAILLLAAVFSGKLIKIKGYEEAGETVAGFDVLLNPFSSIGSIGEISLAKEVKMQNDISIKINCYEGELGKQDLSVNTKGAFGKWSGFTEARPVYDKYIFSDKLEGNAFYIMSKSFELPFRVGDLIYVIGQEYCFVNAPKDIEYELKDVNPAAIKLDKTDNCFAECSKTSKCKTVCFGSGSCSIQVNGCSSETCEKGVVKKDNKNMYFAKSSLMYAAVFSSANTYECNFDRLMKRLGYLSNIYISKADTLRNRGCDTSGIENELNILKGLATTAKADSDTNTLYSKALSLGEKNSYLDCQVF